MKETIKATPNYSRRTFTLRCYQGGVMYAKYRTVKLSEQEFNSCEYNTNNDWYDFFKSNDYYAI